MQRNIESHKSDRSRTIKKVLFNNLESHKKLSSSHRSGTTLRVFFNIMNAWKLSNERQMKILGVPRSTFFKWKKQCEGDLSQDTLERISYIFGIYKALQILLPDPKAADEWVSKPNNAPLFNGRSALDRMLSGQVADLYIVRQYLDSERGGWA
jgi:uncharacterized protein (DUF2384 family)